MGTSVPDTQVVCIKYQSCRPPAPTPNHAHYAWSMPKGKVCAPCVPIAYLFPVPGQGFLSLCGHPMDILYSMCTPPCINICTWPNDLCSTYVTSHYQLDCCIYITTASPVCSKCVTLIILTNTSQAGMFHFLDAS